MKHYKMLLLVGLLSILLPLSKGYAEKRSGIGLVMLGKPISVVNNYYSFGPKMISGPSKRKIICANSSEHLIFTSLKNKVVSVKVIQFAKETSVNNVLIGHSESCRKSMESNFKLELNCEKQKAIVLELDIIAAELRTEFCFFQHCSCLPPSSHFTHFST